MFDYENNKKYNIKSFTFKCLITDNDIHFVNPPRQMYDFFGTNEESYKAGVITRIKNDIGSATADALYDLIAGKASKGEDFRIQYPSMRADGSKCIIQMDGYAIERLDDGYLYNIIDMDISDLLEARKKTEQLSKENFALLNDSPVGLGIYHIKDDKFDLVYTNSEYYRVHYGSKEFWDRFKGQDAMSRILTEDRTSLFEEWEKTKKDPSGHMFDRTYRCKGEDDKIHWIRLKARLSEPEEDGTFICYASYINMDAEIAAEKRVEESNKKLLDTVSNMPSISMLFKILGNNKKELISVSDEYCDLTGFTQKEIWDYYSEDIISAVHPKDKSMLNSFLSEPINEKSENISYRLITKNGNYKWVSSRFFTFSSDGNKYLYNMLNDIDELKRHEQELEKQFLNAQQFLDSLSDEFITTLRVNITKNAVESIDGSDPFSFINKKITYDKAIEGIIKTMPRNKDRNEFRLLFSRESLIKAYESGKKTVGMDYYFKNHDHKIITIHIVANLLIHPTSNDIISFESFDEITENKIIEAVVNDIFIKQYDFLASINVEDRSLNVITANNKSMMTNKSDHDNYDIISSDYINHHIVPDEQGPCRKFMMLENVLEALNNSNNYTASFSAMENEEYRNKKFDYYFIDRECGLIVLIITDYTEVQKKQLEQEERLRSAFNSARQASIAKTEFLSRMSHEIRTPMNAIIGLSTIALKDNDISIAMKDHLKKIDISARFLLSLINDILDMSRIESGKMFIKAEDFNLCNLVNSINTILYSQCEDEGIEYESVIKGYVDENYIGDQTKLQQILINILGNSVKFTPADGKIRFMIEQIYRNQECAILRFSVSDTGIGIDKEYLPHIFETFSQGESGTTTTYSGTGLGLAISKSLIELMGGSIDVHSVKGIGTDFKIDIKFSLSDECTISNNNISRIDSENLKVLVVDADDIACKHCKLVLEKAGINTEYITSSEDAIRHVKETHENTFDLDLILLDYKMPNLNGIETACEIRKIIGHGNTLIILTAYDWGNIEQDARDAGVDNFLMKPIFASSVLKVYNETLSKHSNDQKVVENYDFTGLNILVAEDNAINAEIAKSLLEMTGFNVTVVENGIEAVRTFTDSKVDEFSAILMDIRMPLMDGIKATQTLRKIDRKDSTTIPIIAMSANAFDEDIRKSIESGMNAHLSKPLEAELMYKTLDEFIHQKYVL